MIVAMEKIPVVKDVLRLYEEGKATRGEWMLFPRSNHIVHQKYMGYLINLIVSTCVISY